MPQSEHAKKILSDFEKQYGKKKGKQVYYATANKQDRSERTFRKESNNLPLKEKQMSTQLWKEAALRQSNINRNVLEKLGMTEYGSAAEIGRGKLGDAAAAVKKIPGQVSDTAGKAVDVAKKLPGQIADTARAAPGKVSETAGAGKDKLMGMLSAVREHLAGASTARKIGYGAAGLAGLGAGAYGVSRLGGGEDEAEKEAFWKQAAYNQAILYRELEKQAGIMDILRSASGAVGRAPGQAWSGMGRAAGAIGEAGKDLYGAASAPIRTAIGDVSESRAARDMLASLSGINATNVAQGLPSPSMASGAQEALHALADPNIVGTALGGLGRGASGGLGALNVLRKSNPYGLAGLAGLGAAGAGGGYAGYKALTGGGEDEGIDPQLAALIAQEQGAA